VLRNYAKFVKLLARFLSTHSVWIPKYCTNSCKSERILCNNYRNLLRFHKQRCEQSTCCMQWPKYSCHYEYTVIARVSLLRGHPWLLWTWTKVWIAEKSGFDTNQKQEMYLFCKATRPNLILKHLSLQQGNLKLSLYKPREDLGAPVRPGSQNFWTIGIWRSKGFQP
jgi:hypothetical protein